MYENEIESHKSKISQLDSKIKQLKKNSEVNKNQLLSESINNRILNLEITQIENEITLHHFCIECLIYDKYVDLVLDHKFHNARKKKITKLMKKSANIPLSQL